MIKEEITMEFRKNLEYDHKNTVYQNSNEAAKLACRRKSRTLNVYNRKNPEI